MNLLLDIRIYFINLGLQNSKLRDDKIGMETLITLPFVVTTVFTKVVFAASIFAIYKYFGFVIILIIFTIRVLGTKLIWKNISMENNLLGTLTSLTAPCLLLLECSYFFIITNMIQDVLSLFVTWTTFIVANFDSSEFTINLFKDTIFQCQRISKNFNISQISRCQELSNGTALCTSELFTTDRDFNVTVCPTKSHEWLPLMYLCGILTVLQAFSIVSVFAMNHLSNPINKLKVSRALKKLTFQKFPLLWREKDEDWKDEIIQYLDNKLADEKYASLLRSAISSGGFLCLAKVSQIIQSKYSKD